MLINENLIMLDLKAKDKEEAITKLAVIAQQAGKITSVNDFLASVLEREKSYTTGVGNGIAIPHGKSNAVKEAMIVFGRSESGVEWGSPDGRPVTMIFLLGVPDENANMLHLKVLSHLSRKLMDKNFINKLRSVTTNAEMLNTLSDICVS